MCYSRIECDASFMPMFRGKRRERRAKRGKIIAGNPIAGTRLTFRAELMPGREPNERTFEVTRVLANGRVELMNLRGEHAITEFEPLQ